LCQWGISGCTGPYGSAVVRKHRYTHGSTVYRGPHGTTAARGPYAGTAAVRRYP
jgi:hypothetical protein